MKHFSDAPLYLWLLFIWYIILWVWKAGINKAFTQLVTFLVRVSELDSHKLGGKSVY